MSNQHLIEYICPICGYRNVWTRDEILQRGKKQIFKDTEHKEDRYSLPCKNPAEPHCSERYIVAIQHEED